MNHYSICFFLEFFLHACNPRTPRTFNTKRLKEVDQLKFVMPATNSKICLDSNVLLYIRRRRLFGICLTSESQFSTKDRLTSRIYRFISKEPIRLLFLSKLLHKSILWSLPIMIDELRGS